MIEFAILALQGGFALHQKMLKRAGFRAKLIKKPEELEGVQCLIIPGGESTTILKLMSFLNWRQAILNFHKKGHFIFGTCAGMILLSKCDTFSKKYLGLIDICIERNAYGRQMESFNMKGTSILGISQLKMTCIRAPKVTSIGKDVEILATLGKEPMLLKQENVVVATFHPELSRELEFYHWLGKVVSNKISHHQV